MTIVETEKDNFGKYFYMYKKAGWKWTKRHKATLLKPIIAINHFKLIGSDLIGILYHFKKSWILFKFKCLL